MNTNDVLRRVRYAAEADTVRLCALGGVEVSAGDVDGWLAREGDPAFVVCPERALTAFLDGLVLDRRGPRDPSAPRPPEVRLDNNVILKKLRVAFRFQDEDMLAVLAAGHMPMSASELGALFRKPDHKHYRACGDQVLRKFLAGLTEKLRGPGGEPDRAEP